MHTSDDDDESSDDDSSDEDDDYEDYEYEGVDYIINKNSNKIYNDDFIIVGTYEMKNDKITNVKWKNKKFEKEHNKNIYKTLKAIGMAEIKA